MESGRLRFRSFQEQESEGKESTDNLGSHYAAEMEVPVSYAPPAYDESAALAEDEYAVQDDDEDEMEKFSRGRSRSHSMHMNDTLPEVNGTIITPIDPNTFIAQGGYRGQIGGEDGEALKGADRVNRTGPLPEREVQVLIKGLEEASPHRNQTQIEEEQEEIRAAESEKRHRAVAKLTTTTVTEVSDQNMRRVKILMLGDSGVGKTSLIMRWTADTFSANMVGTVGVNFKTKRILIDGEYVQVQVWDTAGQEQFHKITTSYYRGANAIILVYDLSDPKTIDNVHYWLTNIKSHATESVHVALIGNKSDLKVSGASSSSSSSSSVDAPLSGQHWADKLGVKHFETSAKDSTNVDEAFMTVVSSYLAVLKPGNGNGGSASTKDKGGGSASGGSGGGAGGSSVDASTGKSGKKEKKKSKLKLGLPKSLGGGKKSSKSKSSSSSSAVVTNADGSQSIVSSGGSENGDEHSNSHGHGGHSKKDKEKCTIS